MAVSGKQDESISEGDHLVVLVHGINTRASWFGTVKPSLEDAGFIVASAGYELYGVFRFLLPFERLRRRAIARVTTKIRLARQLHPHAKMSVIAHSFGSFVVAQILEYEFDLKWHRIILCGSVVREDLPLEQYLQRFDAPIVNEIGTNDFWPALARAITWGYGSVGSYGFQSPAVTDRWHAGFHHSDFLTQDFCKQFWIPFLHAGTLARGDAPSPLPLPSRVFTRLPLRWIALCVIIAVLVLVPAGVAPWATWRQAIITLLDGKTVERPPFIVWVIHQGGGAPARHVLDARKLEQARTLEAFRQLLIREIGPDLDTERGIDDATVFRLADRAVVTATERDPTSGGNRALLVVPNKLLQRFDNNVTAFNFFKAQLPE
jgi:putative serine esterase DUF676